MLVIIFVRSYILDVEQVPKYTFMVLRLHNALICLYTFLIWPRGHMSKFRDYRPIFLRLKFGQNPIFLCWQIFELFFGFRKTSATFFSI